MCIKHKPFHITAILCSFLTACAVFTLILSSPANAQTNLKRVTTTTELQTAMKTAQPGDEIVIASGVYIGKLGSNASGFGSAFFNSDMQGTKDKPIIMRSEDPQNPAQLQGTGTNTGYVLRITGDYWIIKDLNINTAQKGIIFDNSSNSIITGCTVTNIGMEGIHLRDGSCNNLIENCTVTYTGVARKGMGEGIYIGSDKGKWEEFDPACDYNTVRDCTLGPYIDSEHVDIKEGTTGTIVENCTMDGIGISGGNYADSFIDIKGDQSIIRNNTCFRNNNTIIVDAVQLHNQLDFWGRDNQVYNNTFYLDDSRAYVVNATNITTCNVSGNIRIPSGNMYTGGVTEIEVPAETAITASVKTTVSNGKVSAEITVTGGNGIHKYNYYLVKNANIYYVKNHCSTTSIEFNKPYTQGEYQLIVYIENEHGSVVASCQNTIII